MNDHWTPIDWPNLPDIDQQRLSQVWFTGMHSDVGGGYSQDRLSYVTLDWMMDRAEVYGLLLKGLERTRLSQFTNTFDKLNDSRHGLGGPSWRTIPCTRAGKLSTDSRAAGSNRERISQAWRAISCIVK